MSYFYFGVLFFIITILQTMAPNPLSYGGYKPDFFLLLVVYINLYSPKNDGLWSGIAGGFLEDVISGGPTGSATLLKFICGWSVSFIKYKIVVDNLLAQILLVFGVSIVDTIVRLFLFEFLGGMKPDLVLNLRLCFVPAILTTLAAPPFFWLIRKGHIRWGDARAGIIQN